MMLALDSPRWSELEAAGGNPLLVPRLVQSLATNPTDEDWVEVWEQLSHQWSPYSIAFAALPHLVQLAMQRGLETDPDFLLGLARTVDVLVSLGSPPADLRDAYDAALQQIKPIAERAAKEAICFPRRPRTTYLGVGPPETGSPEARYSAKEYVPALYALCALSGRERLGRELFFCLVASGPELDCPKCRAYLSGEFEEDGLVFQSRSSTWKPLSEEAWVTPRTQADVSKRVSGQDDFPWLVDLCCAAKQEEILLQVSHLYGTVTCPLCKAEFVPILEIVGSRAGLK
jgi:hypothetical protein